MILSIDFFLQQRFRKGKLVPDCLVIPIVELPFLTWWRPWACLKVRAFVLVAFLELLPNFFHLSNLLLILTMQSLCNISSILNSIKLTVHLRKRASFLLTSINWFRVFQNGLRLVIRYCHVSYSTPRRLDYSSTLLSNLLWWVLKHTGQITASIIFNVVNVLRALEEFLRLVVRRGILSLSHSDCFEWC